VQTAERAAIFLEIEDKREVRAEAEKLVGRGGNECRFCFG
jgi:hypothetical protein